VVNTMEEIGGELVLGGGFSYTNDTVNVIKWSDGNGFVKYGNGIANEVNDFQEYKNVLYAVCRHTVVNDTSVLMKLTGNQWVKESLGIKFESLGQMTLNTLCINEENSLLVGGNFHVPLSGIGIANSYSLYRGSKYLDWMYTDSAVTKMVLYKGRTIYGGRFGLYNQKKYYKGIAH